MDTWYSYTSYIMYMFVFFHGSMFFDSVVSLFLLSVNYDIVFYSV